MAQELASILVNPSSLRRSRTGGIIARLGGRTDLELVHRDLRCARQLDMDQSSALDMSSALDTYRQTNV